MKPFPFLPSVVLSKGERAGGGEALLLKVAAGGAWTSYGLERLLGWHRVPGCSPVPALAELPGMLGEAPARC